MEDPPMAESAPTADGVPGPPTEPAPQFTILSHPSEIILILGRNRAVFNEAGNAKVAVEWLGSFSIPATVAKQLAAGLVQAVQEWEKANSVTLKAQAPDIKKL